MKEGLFIVLVIVISTALVGTVLMNPAGYVEDKMNKFNSMEELSLVLQEANQKDYFALEDLTRGGMLVGEIAATSVEGMQTLGSNGVSTDFSTTNIQVAGVDEADIVKTDGKYLYVLTGNKLVIMDAYPADQAEILSETEISGNAIELFINENKLTVFSNDYNYAVALVYDISSKTNPTLEKKVELEGNYFDSRMIGDYVYMIVNQPLRLQENQIVDMPLITINNAVKEVEATDVYYFDEKDEHYGLTSIVSINLNENEMKTKTFLKGNSQEMFVSMNNIYLVAQNRFAVPVPLTDVKVGLSNTVGTTIHKLAISNGDIGYVASGEVPGRILNQFSMDEYNGYFRVATTIRGYSNNVDTSTNNMYVLNEEMETVGELEGIAAGESIYSVRFMGDRAYMVTFRHVDPLFVIDLSVPEMPRILGKLKIPGYSDYLHPYDENHIIGIGKEVDASIDADKIHTEGAVYYTAIQGVKISIFDVSDVANPIEMDKVVIGDRGTESLATTEHKAFLFDKEKNLLVVPITLAELKEGQDKSMQGEFTFQGAYVYNLDLNGFSYKGRITHVEDDSLEKSGYYFRSPYSIRRSLYMDDVLYTVSNGMVKMNNLNDLSEINKIVLPYENQNNYGYYEQEVGIAEPMVVG